MRLLFEHPWFLLFWASIPIAILLSLKYQGKISLILILRVVILFLAGLTLANPQLNRFSDRVNVMFCLDISQSIQSDMKQKAVSFITSLISHKGDEDQVGLIVFGKSASVEKDLQSEFSNEPLQSTVNSNFTNIRAALQTAIGRLPSRGSNKIILLSDGLQNLEKAEELSQLAASLRVPIFPVLIGEQVNDLEVSVEHIKTPTQVKLNQPFSISIILKSLGVTRGSLFLYRNNTLLKQKNLSLQKGITKIEYIDQLTQPDLYRYKAIVQTKADLNRKNNQGFSFTNAKAYSKLLHVSTKPQNKRVLRSILKEQGFKVDSLSADRFPTQRSDLLAYDAIILENVAAFDFDLYSMALVEDYVKEFGGGLLMIGGPKSFGAGGYTGTAIENVLPVYMDPPTTLEFPGLSLLLMIDKSSSMGERLGRQSKLEAAKIAAFSTVEVLNPMDQVGLLAFDTSFRWIVPFSRANKREKIAYQLKVLKDGGGTNLAPAIEEAVMIMKSTKAARKHIIILSDGITEEDTILKTVKQLSQAGVTLSTIALGKSANIQLLQKIAQSGGGRAYYTDHSSQIPRIFVDETKIVATDVIREKKLTPEITATNELTQILSSSQIPALEGIVITYLKPKSDLLLITDEGPLLVSWRYGLGHSLAFTSDLNGRWSKAWLKWGKLGPLVANMVRWVQKRESSLVYQTTIKRKQDKALLTIDALNSEKQFINHLDLQISVLFPSKHSQLLDISQVAPGRYQVEFPSEEVGEYFLNLSGGKNNDAIGIHTIGFGLAMLDEHKQSGNNRQLLNLLAKQSKGTILNLDKDYPELFKTEHGNTDTGQDLWPYFLVFTILLFVLEIAIRKFGSIKQLAKE